MIKVPHPTVLDNLRCPPYPSETEMVVEFPFVTDLQIRLMNLLAHDNRDAVVHLNGVLALAARSCDNVASMVALLQDHIDGITRLRTKNRDTVKEWCRLHHPGNKPLFRNQKFIVNKRFSSWLDPLNNLLQFLSPERVLSDSSSASWAHRSLYWQTLVDANSRCFYVC